MQPFIGTIEIELPPIDFRRLHLIAETEGEKASFLEIFFKTAEETIAEMKEASCKDANAEWKNAAHKLRGASANIGMAALEKLCLDSERITWAASGARGDMLQKIADEIARVKNFIAEKDPFLLVSGI